MHNRRAFLGYSLAFGALAGLTACASAATSTATATATGTTAPSSGGGMGGPAPQAGVSVDPDVVAAFKQGSFADPKTGDTLKYNVFTPAGYDGSNSYPLVLFMEDSSVVGSETTKALTQGLGAIYWATAADQAKRPCFVLAPQYASVVVNDNSEATSLLDTT